MGSKGSSAPEPPDPRETSAAQTGTNVGTALANSAMQMVDQVTPYGNLSYEQTDTYTYNDPYTGKTYQIPRYKATTELSPEEQYKLQQNQAAESNLADVAVNRSEFLKDYLPQTGAMTDAIDSKLYDLADSRLAPRFERQREDLRTRLVNQGITPGSEAFNREMDMVGQSQNDAYNQMVLQGRGQALAEVNQPINQITALLSGSQVQNPNVSMQTPGAIPTTDNAGLINQNYNQRFNNWQVDQKRRQGMLGGLFDATGALGSAGIQAGWFGSDRRLKADAQRHGERAGVGVWSYRYLGSAKRQVGLMADEVAAVMPHAVRIKDGFAEVNYAEALA